jgi:hypothetical protein
VGDKPLKRWQEALGVFWENAGVETVGETRQRSPERRKASKGEAQERWELREASEVGGG